MLKELSSVFQPLQGAFVLVGHSCGVHVMHNCGVKGVERR